MFRFTIRDVLWLTVVVALAVGWWLEHRAMNSAYKKLRISTEHAERRAEEAKELAAEERIWRDTAIAREREMRTYVDKLQKQLGSLDVEVQIDESGMPIVTARPSRNRPTRPNPP